MTDDDALAMIREALNTVTPGSGDKVTAETDLQKDEILDSLDLMNFLFELEQKCGRKLEEIDEEFDDYQVSRLIGILQNG